MNAGGSLVLDNQRPDKDADYLKRGMMLTIFSTCKPFRGHIEIIQRNAIRSWTLLHPEVEVVLLGDDEGTAEAAQELGVRHIPEVDRNEHGTPLLSSIFQKAQAAARHDIVCYVNADIVLMGDFIKAVGRVKAKGFKRFLMVGQRWDVDIGEPWDYARPDWEARLRSHVCTSGHLHPTIGIDYFAFPKDSGIIMPPLILGRTVWDHWIIYDALSRRMPVIDATQGVMSIHQNHDFSHHPGGEVWIWEGPEARSNEELAGVAAVFDIQDATWILTPQGLWPALTPRHLRRRLATLSLLHPKLRPWTKAVRSLLGIQDKVPRPKVNDR